LNMAKKNNPWLVREISYLLLSPFLVLLGILAYGILFDQWYKDPLLILQYSGMTYGAILVLRFFQWIIKGFSK
jgi:hypothetical protein